MISSTAQMGKLRPNKRQDLPKAIWKSPGFVCCPSGCLAYPPCWVAHLLAHFPTPVLVLCWRLLLVWGHIWKGHRDLAWGSLESIIPHPPGGFEGAVLRCGRQGQWAAICGYHGSLGGTRGERGWAGKAAGAVRRPPGVWGPQRCGFMFLNKHPWSRLNLRAV